VTMAAITSSTETLCSVATAAIVLPAWSSVRSSSTVMPMALAAASSFGPSPWRMNPAAGAPASGLVVVPDAGAPAAGFMRHGDGPKLEAAAKAIGITVDELRTELEAGKTIAAVATEHNVPVDTVIDAMVTEATANLKDRITDLVNNGFPKPGPRARFHRFVERHEDFAKIAGVIGISEDDLKTAIQSGQSIADIAKAHGVDPQKVIDALVAEGVPTDRATNIVNHVGGFHHRGPDDSPDTAPATPSSVDA